MEIENFVDKLYDLKVDIVDSPIYNYGVILDSLLRRVYNTEGIDIINNWLYELGYNKENSDIESIDKLYDYVNKHCKLCN